MPNHVPDTEDERTEPPPESLLLAYAATIPTVSGALLATVLPRPAARVVSGLTITWTASILCFLSGVRRGLSFRQPGGATANEIGTTLLLFTAGSAALLSPSRKLSLWLLLLGFGAELGLDPRAAERGEAPRYFARLRPRQLPIPLASLAVLLARERADRGNG